MMGFLPSSLHVLPMPFRIVAILALVMVIVCSRTSLADEQFSQQVRPLLKQHCFGCHNADEMESGIRLDHLDGTIPDQHIRLWEEIRKQLLESKMPPEDELQPTAGQRDALTDWIRDAVETAKRRPTKVNGSARRLTVTQYRNTLRDLLGLTEDLTDILPPDAVSKNGFTNDAQVMQMSPLQIEAYFNIAERALDLCIVDEDVQPKIQNFRMDLGKGVNPDPISERLILGANNRLLDNQDFVVHQLDAKKPFEFTPSRMRTKYRFNEGYQGNSTVRGWRTYDSIYHAVFACMRGNHGYPKGKAYESVSDGLLLRPAIPSAEIFGQESTYGPKANFKISLRELPDHGNFRVTVRAAKYDDGLLLNPGVKACEADSRSSVTVDTPETQQTTRIPESGIYQIDVHNNDSSLEVEPDDTRLSKQLIGRWSFDGHVNSQSHNGQPAEDALIGHLTKGAAIIDSPFDHSLSVDGKTGSVVVARDDRMNVAKGDFTVAAWIRPRSLRQGGIVCLGKYSWVHGWYFDMPDSRGVLRIETVGPDNKPNGTVASPAGTIRANKWQHVAAVVRRGENKTRLYVNGFQVAQGSVADSNLDNPNVALHLGRIQESKLFEGEIDEVYLFRRALGKSELQALIEPGRQFVQPPTEKPQNLSLQLGQRYFSGTLRQPAFLIARLEAGLLPLKTDYAGNRKPTQVVMTRLNDEDKRAIEFAKFEKRIPRVGVHLGLRRDCGSTFAPVGPAQQVSDTAIGSFVFEGAINDYPSPDVQDDNDNYLAGIREIGIRSEYTDGRDMPRLQIQSVEFEGPLYESWPPKTHQQIFFDSPNSKTKDETYAREVIASFATRAFRRKVTNEESDALLSIWRSSFADTGDFQQSVRDALLVVLTSPQFLFLIEDSSTPNPEKITDHELASKLSYFLWNTAPDSELLRLASDGTLSQKLDEQIDRLIDDPRFQQFADEFASQWLSLKKLDVVETNRRKYPRLSREAKRALREEPQRLLSWLIRENKEARHLVQSDIVMANEIVAGYYDLAEKTESGLQFVPIQHGRTTLGGVLTQAGILAALSDGRESNPVKRGAWLARKIIAEPPDDPPPNVPELEDLTKLSLRERLEKHRNQPGCANCHSGIDPWGIALEQYDAGGLVKREKVATDSILPDGTKVAGVAELKQYLAGTRLDQVAFSFTKHLSAYAIGRSLTYNETEKLRSTVTTLKSDGYKMRAIIHFVIKHDLFLTK